MCRAGPKPVMRVPDTDSQEKYDSYLTKLQNICTEQVGEEGGGGGGPGGGAPVKPVYESMKSAIQNMSVQTAQT